MFVGIPALSSQDYNRCLELPPVEVTGYGHLATVLCWLVVDNSQLQITASRHDLIMAFGLLSDTLSSRPQAVRFWERLLSVDSSG